MLIGITAFKKSVSVNNSVTACFLPIQPPDFTLPENRIQCVSQDYLQEEKSEFRLKGRGKK
ncbi:hypothetical protein DENIS_2703 [Desulfonema ishimotonii]|uniref:Uncharacterized protein n=1 Tax=Desulfonema ishimotonii TaxID=45657 RepID=A0A401FXQ1_9BACT|nr:hypothetical protein DENIS_2703 [Desulfonema ishimotonii]